VLFLQSGLDKVFDNKGNLEWMTPHFANSPLRSMVPVLLAVVTVLELSAGAMSGVGAVMLFFGRANWAVVGLSLAGLVLVCLFAGQRLAKDYVGAAVLATYFGVALFGLYLLSV
jgi:hypothetical protein